MCKPVCRLRSEDTSHSRLGPAEDAGACILSPFPTDAALGPTREQHSRPSAPLRGPSCPNGARNALHTSPGSQKPTFYAAPRRRRRADGPGRSPANFTRTNRGLRRREARKVGRGEVPGAKCQVREDGPGRSPANFTRTNPTRVKTRRGGAPPTSGEQVEGRRREVRGTCGGEAPPARPRSGSESGRRLSAAPRRRRENAAPRSTPEHVGRGATTSAWQVFSLAKRVGA